jgi:hypothetical protein
MTPEGKVKAKIKKLLKQYPLWDYWPVPSGFGRRTVDALGLYCGHFFAIEAKRPGKDPTALQARELEDIAAKGGTTFVIDDDEGVQALAEWLEGIRVTNDDGPRQPKT